MQPAGETEADYATEIANLYDAAYFYNHTDSNLKQPFMKLKQNMKMQNL